MRSDDTVSTVTICYCYCLLFFVSVCYCCFLATLLRLAPFARSSSSSNPLVAAGGGRGQRRSGNRRCSGSCICNSSSFRRSSSGSDLRPCRRGLRRRRRQCLRRLERSDSSALPALTCQLEPKLLGTAPGGSQCRGILLHAFLGTLISALATHSGFELSCVDLTEVLPPSPLSSRDLGV